MTRLIDTYGSSHWEILDLWEKFKVVVTDSTETSTHGAWCSPKSLTPPLSYPDQVLYHAIISQKIK